MIQAFEGHIQQSRCRVTAIPGTQESPKARRALGFHEAPLGYYVLEDAKIYTDIPKWYQSRGTLVVPEETKMNHRDPLPALRPTDPTRTQTSGRLLQCSAERRVGPGVGGVASSYRPTPTPPTLHGGCAAWRPRST